jgi:hypothetical protein
MNPDFAAILSELTNAGAELIVVTSSISPGSKPS